MNIIELLREKKHLISENEQHVILNCRLLDTGSTRDPYGFSMRQHCGPDRLSAKSWDGFYQLQHLNLAIIRGQTTSYIDANDITLSRPPCTATDQPLPNFSFQGLVTMIFQESIISREEWNSGVFSFHIGLQDFQNSIFHIRDDRTLRMALKQGRKQFERCIVINNYEKHPVSFLLSFFFFFK